jgi:hypothetical protein
VTLVLLAPYITRFRHVAVAGCVELERTAIRIFLLIFVEIGLQFEMSRELGTRGPTSSMLSSEVCVDFGGGGWLEGKWVETRFRALQAKLSPLGTKTNGVIFYASIVV